MKNRIAEVLKERNMKQIELARQLNVGRSRVSNWCSSSSTPNIQMLIRISNAARAPEVSDADLVMRQDDRDD